VQSCVVPAASCTRSVAVVTVRGIAIPIVARIEAAIPAVNAAAIPAAETTPVSAVKTVAIAAIKTVAPEPAAVEPAAKAVGLGRTNANRGGERDSNDRNSHQVLAGHVTLLFTFRIRLRHRMPDRYAGTRLAGLAKKRCLAC